MSGHRETQLSESRRDLMRTPKVELIAALADALAQRDRARDLLARAVRLERWASIGSTNSHAQLSPIRREVWDSIVEELKR